MSETVHESEATSGARDYDRCLAAIWADDRRALFQKLRCLLDAWEVLDSWEQMFAESFWTTSVDLQVCRAGYGANYIGSRVGEAARSDGDGKHERHGHRHPDSREQLLYAVDSQPPAVEVHQRIRLHQSVPARKRSCPAGLGNVAGAAGGTGRWIASSTARSRPSSMSWPSRSV